MLQLVLLSLVTDLNSVIAIEVLPNQAVWPSKSPVFEGSALKTSGLLMALRSSIAYAPGALF